MRRSWRSDPFGSTLDTVLDVLMIGALAAMLVSIAVGLMLF